MTLPQRQGIRYERKFGRYLSREWSDGARLWSGHWVEFLDDEGFGWAQPDHVLVTDGEVWIFENKLTYREEGWAQLTGLYLPLVLELVGTALPTKLVQVTKNLDGRDWRMFGATGGHIELDNLEDLRSFTVDPTEPSRFLFHWLGV